MPAPDTLRHVLLPPSSATPVRAPAIEVPWFYGGGGFVGENHDLQIDWLQSGSHATSGGYTGLNPTIFGIWQVTFSCERYSYEFDPADGEMAAGFYGVDGYGLYGAGFVLPYFEDRTLTGSATSSVVAGPAPLHIIGATLNDIAGGAQGWLVGHLITELEPPPSEE